MNRAMKADEKSSLRSRIRKQLHVLSIEEQKTKSRQLCHHLEHSDYFKTADPVLTFASLPGEPDLFPLFEKRVKLQSFCFPRVIGSQLEIRQVQNQVELIPAYARIQEPSPTDCPLFPRQDLRIILLPGLAFDPVTGARLGKGKGFYDRLIKDLRARPNHSVITIGICFDCQLTSVPEESHDQRVDAIVTESGILTTES